MALKKKKKRSTPKSNYCDHSRGGKLHKENVAVNRRCSVEKEVLPACVVTGGLADVEKYHPSGHANKSKLYRALECCNQEGLLIDESTEQVRRDG